MIKYTEGNLLDAEVEALVNTVNTVGVMGKGIALMFKERFPKNMKEYQVACKEKRVVTGKMFVTEADELLGPRWIVNFPTKQHWRAKSRMDWILDGLKDLHSFIVSNNVKSIAIPPLGAGNGGLNWKDVKAHVEAEFSDLEGVKIIIYEPTKKYQNVAKKQGVKKLTPARVLIAELVRRYEVLGMECSLLEIQKLAWFLQRVMKSLDMKDELKLNFEAHNYGPFANNLNFLLDALDGNYLKADKRIPDSSPTDVIWFNDEKKECVSTYLSSEAKSYLPALEKASEIIDGFESPYGMELLSSIDWLLNKEGCVPNLDSVLDGLKKWPAGKQWGDRKIKLFKPKHIEIALNRLVGIPT